jgi:ribosome-binding ATPase
VSFLTVGPDEVRAWPISKGSNAQKAAGKIHSDIERGFIRAEVIGYKDLLECGTLVEAKRQGLLRLEGKTYIVQDGDVINFLFNV